METKRLKIGNYVYGAHEDPETLSLVRVDNVSDDGINYNDTDNTYQYTAENLSPIPLTAAILLLSDFKKVNNRYVNNHIGFIKMIHLNGTWMWYSPSAHCIPVETLNELQNFYEQITGNVLLVDEEGLAAELSKKIVLLQPEKLVASEITQITAKISWEASIGADGYKYTLDDGITWSNIVEDTFIVLEGLTHDSDYDIRIKAIGDGVVYSDSPASEALSFSTIDLEVLDTPGAEVTTFDDESITVGWGAVDNAEGYTITWGEALTQDVLSDVLTYKIEGLSANTEYTITVKALGDGIVSDDSIAAEVLQTTDKTQLDTPVVTGEPLSSSSVKFSWAAIDNASGYKYSTDEGANWTDTELLEVTLTDLQADTLYGIDVVAVGSGNYRDSEAGSAEVSTLES